MANTFTWTMHQWNTQAWPVFELHHNAMFVSYHTNPRPAVQVTWRPPQTYLHYNELYAGIYEYLREPPAHQHKAAAQEYLTNLRESNFFPLASNPSYIQNHRIRWVQEWLKALPEDQDECSDAETEVHQDIEEVW